MRWVEQGAIALTTLTGRIPQHVALIMDGNRRFATRRGHPAHTGHASGYSTMLRVLEWCLDLGVKVATVFAFSIENFNRPQAEVDTLMNMAQQKFIEFMDKSDLVMERGIRVRVLGDLSLLPAQVRATAAKVMLATASHSCLTLNICFSYTSGEETSRTVRDVVRAAREGLLLKDDMDEVFLSRCLYTRDSQPDLLVRTSGETRLSDFLVWQLSRAHLCFLDATWPDVTLWKFLRCVWDYQSHCTAAPGPLRDLALHEDPAAAAKGARQEAYLRRLEAREGALYKMWAL